MTTIELGSDQPSPRISRSGVVAAICTIGFFVLVILVVFEGTAGQKIDGRESLYRVLVADLKMDRFTVQDGVLYLERAQERRILDTPRLLRTLGMARDEYAATQPGDELRCREREHRGFFTNFLFATQFMCRRKTREGPDATSGPFDFIKMP